MALNLETRRARGGRGHAGNVASPVAGSSAGLGHRVLDGAVGDLEGEVGVDLAAGFRERHLGLGVDLPPPLLGAVVGDELHALHLVVAGVVGGEDVGVEDHARENPALERVARRLPLARAEVVAPLRIGHDDVDAERGEELRREDDDFDGALLHRFLLLFNRLRRGRRGPVVVAVEVPDARGGADERPEEGGDPHGERVVGDGFVGDGQIGGDGRLEERLENRGETDDTEADVEEHARRFAHGVLVHEHQDASSDHHDGHPRALEDGGEDVGARRCVERVELQREAEEVGGGAVVEPRRPRMEPVDVILAILPLGEIGVLRLARVFLVVGRAHQVEGEPQPHQRADRDARDDGGASLLAPIGVHSLRVARVEEGVALDERLGRPHPRGRVRGLVPAVVGEAAVVVHRREALPDLLGVFATPVEARELLEPQLDGVRAGPAGSGAHAAPRGAAVGGRPGGDVDGVAHGLAAGGALGVRAPVLLEIPAVLVVVVAILRAVARAPDDHAEFVREVAHHPDAEREHGDGDGDEADASLATRGEDLRVADDDLDLRSRLLVILLLLVVEELVLGLFPQRGLERREHLRGEGGGASSVGYRVPSAGGHGPCACRFPGAWNGREGQTVNRC